MRYVLTLISALPALALSQTTAGLHVERFQGTLTRQVQMDYLLFVSDGYNTKQKWPLIIYLHGGSLRGNEIEKLRDSGPGILGVVQKNRSFPFVVLAPQCPAGEYWTDTEALADLLGEVLKEYSVDPARVYLTGHSMGGFGAWYLAYKHP